MCIRDRLQPDLHKQYEAIVKGVQDGALDEAIRNQNVKRILEMILQTPHFKGYKYSNKPDLKGASAVRSSVRRARRRPTSLRIPIASRRSRRPRRRTFHGISLKP